MHLSSLKRRLEKILVLKEHVRETIHTFESYAQAGQRLTDSLMNLADSFECYNEFQKDSSFRSIHSVLCDCQSTLSGHYRQIHDFVVKPLRDFLNKDVSQAEENGRQAAHEIDAYMRASDLYVSGGRKKADSDSERESRLIAAHLAAAEADLAFEQSLAQVERKTLLEVSTNVYFVF
jgi:hypothetical protein